MRLIDLIIKDVKTVVYDIRSLAIILIMPIVLMSILGMSLQVVFGDESESGIINAHIGVVKNYNYDGEMAKVAGRVDLDSFEEDTISNLNAEKHLFNMLDGDEIRDFITYELVTEDKGFDMLANGELDAVLVLPKDFIFNSYMMLSGSRLISDIKYYVNPEDDFVAGMLGNIFASYVETNNNEYAKNRFIMTDFVASLPEGATVDGAMFETDVDHGTSQIEVSMKSVYRNETISSFQYYAAAIMCMFLLYSAGVGGRALLEERKEQTIPRLTVSGNGLGKIVLSNYIRVVMLVIIQSMIMIVYSALVLKVDWGNPVVVLVTMLLSSLAIASIGTLIAIVTLIANNYKVANAFEFGLIYVMALIGGSFIPVEQLPEGVGKLSFLSVNGQALKMYIRGMYDLSLASNSNEITMILTFTVIMIVASLILIQWKGRELAC